MSGGSGITGGAETARNDEFFRVLRLLADSETLQAEYLRLDNARKDAQAIVDLVGPTNEILKIRGEIDDLKVQAQTALDDAKAQAKKLVADAELEKQKLINDANAYQQSATDHVNQLTESVRQQQLVCDARVAEITAQSEEADKREAALNQRQADLDALAASLTERQHQQEALAKALETMISDTHDRLTALKG